jgi:hypothetical protein
MANLSCVVELGTRFKERFACFVAGTSQFHARKGHLATWRKKVLGLEFWPLNFLGLLPQL